MLEKALENLLDCKSMSLGLRNPSTLKEKNPEFTGRTNAEAEVPILWPPDAKSQLNGKDPDAWKD